MTLPKAFFFRRFHSLTGLWLSLYLVLHLFTNSQAALPIGQQGRGFIKAVNDINELPYLHTIELLLLAIPFGFHAIWGIKYLFTGESNAVPSDGTKPSLPEYSRNHAFTWQRITSWILLVLITFHVIHMRFIEKPIAGQKGSERYFIVRVNSDPGLPLLASHLGVTLYNPQEIEQMKEPAMPSQNLSPLEEQSIKEEREWIKALKTAPVAQNQRIASSNNFATAELLMVRDTFKSPAMILLYTLLVLSACFHGFNGLWTFMITWGITLSASSQRWMRHLTTFIMFLVAFLGLSTIYATYWINLT